MGPAAEQGSVFQNRAEDAEGRCFTPFSRKDQQLGSTRCPEFAQVPVCQAAVSPTPG